VTVASFMRIIDDAKAAEWLRASLAVSTGRPLRYSSDVGQLLDKFESRDARHDEVKDQGVVVMGMG